MRSEEDMDTSHETFFRRKSLQDAVTLRIHSPGTRFLRIIMLHPALSTLETRMSAPATIREKFSLQYLSKSLWHYLYLT